jgi:hypothetical protein
LKYKNFLTRTCSRQLRKREVWSLLFVFFFSFVGTFHLLSVYEFAF